MDATEAASAAATGAVKAAGEIGSGVAEQVRYWHHCWSESGVKRALQEVNRVIWLSPEPWGIVALLAGLSLSLFGAGASWEFILKAVSRVVFSLLIALIASLVTLRFLPRLPFGRRLILQTGLLAGAGGGSAPESDRRWLGKSGTALSPLRPAGIAEIEGERVDVGL